ncbi:oxysterol-binding protein-related protein 6-like isoform X1 [Cydia strobilella]|uniref:oxysterol-binding protein-related protein 6-like isoform X1 n=1 Tax=Cydia strobilella TaxID=1100964 RepID=UPI003006A45A
MSQVKHSDPAAVDKPDRRRGAAGRAAALRRAPSDSDCSGETASLSADSGERRPPPPPPRGKSRNRRRGSEWEVLEGLKDGQRFERRPEVFNGFLHKKRKWPLKGWHKRFFVVDGGILVYARSPTDVARGRLHGSLDVGLSVISAKPRRRRIDIDADEFIYHLRAKTPDVFRTWLNVLKAHRLYRQHLLTFGARESVPKINAPLDDLPPTTDTSSRLISPNGAPIRGPQAGFVSGTPGGRLAGWIVESGGPLESASRELGQAQLSVQQLQRLLDAMLEIQNMHHHDTDQVSLEGASPNVKKDRRKFGLRKKKSNSKCASIEIALPHVDCSSSHMALSALTAPPSPGGGSSSMPNSAASLPIAFLSTFLASTLVPCAAARPQSLPGAEALSVGTGGGPTSLTSLTPDHQLREDFTILAKDLVTNLKTVVSTLVVERGRLRAAMEAAETPVAGGVVAALRTNLSSALQQNSVVNTELRSRLSRIHDASDLAEISSVNNSDQSTLQQAPRPFPQSLSYSSSCVSASEFFDAEEHDELKPTEIITTDEAGVIELDGDSSSEAGSLSSEEGSASSDNSDGARSAVIPTERTPLQNGSGTLTTIYTRRSRLPCPRPTPASPSLWNLLYKNIGKDLSQISMPVTINEPLNMLQRLCEELEYSELLDSASSCNNELDRMSLIAAFAVSAYAASAHRAASKPFNPLLAETYEYVRGERDFRFIAEQVSHHPPISACHAESPRWTFWQEARIKTKFWGKSMEFQPTGRVHVRLTPSGDHYSWNKVTTCVHNLFGGQRWVDQYGDMHIVCHGTDITCKLQFIKASSWSSSRHEVRGVVAVGGQTRMRLQGRWSEGLQGGERTLWRPGPMPPDYELYYGFTRFAMELNELEPGMRDVLPSTDTRLRPDQRALEEGDVDAAEQFKHELEQAQRERRRDGVEHTPLWFRKTIEDGEETWVFTGEYWKAREAGFADTPRLW